MQLGTHLYLSKRVTNLISYLLMTPCIMYVLSLLYGLWFSSFPANFPQDLCAEFRSVARWTALFQCRNVGHCNHVIPAVKLFSTTVLSVACPFTLSFLLLSFFLTFSACYLPPSLFVWLSLFLPSSLSVCLFPLLFSVYTALHSRTI